MYDFVSHVLRRYFEATGWNEQNSYLNLTSSSSAILDFPIPQGISLSISSAPSIPFFTTYKLRALPSLTGSLGYIYASTDPEQPPLDIGNSSKDVRIKQLIERFRLFENPRHPTAKDEVWLNGRRVDTRDYLIYGSMHLPTSRMDALFTTRLSSTWQLIMTAVSTPPRYPISILPSSISASSLAGGSGATTSSSSSVEKSSDLTTNNASASSSSPSSGGAGPPGSTNLQIILQNDTGRWFTEYCYSADDALWGFRVLHNFGTPSSATPTAGGGLTWTTKSEARIDEINPSGEESVAGGGLRGRFSAGAELFFSAVEKSAGLSTGIRFTTLPDPPAAPAPSSGSGTTVNASSNVVSSSNTTTHVSTTTTSPSQPPMTITATLNPMMGHLSTAYAAKMSRDLVASSRFDFNVYSYESQLSMGVEYWLRSGGVRGVGETNLASLLTTPPPSTDSKTYSLREVDRPRAPQEEVGVEGKTESEPPPVPPTPPAETLRGVIKAKVSTNADVSLLWEGRMNNCLVSFGVKADFNPTSSSATRTSRPSSSAYSIQPLKSVGLEVLYFSTANEKVSRA
ncbi:hypothetical protein IE53DRAFT_346193 [Violaceomyces palustris]|uniref:Uncharacterized protein n=1 Tax=Violaceomyces palustris TaxID=1673888 RepID=A0ACD0NTU0_9BASI|nr:hypothetical protein IE53DRAFT_346193 [Violaceomyces palustris]